MFNNTDWFGLLLKIVLVLCVACTIAVSIFIVTGVHKMNEDCRAHGGKIVIDHYITTYISTKVGSTTTFMPINSPVYKCIDQ